MQVARRPTARMGTLVPVTVPGRKDEGDAHVAASQASLWVEALTRGEAGAESQLMEIVYRELRKLARAFLQRERVDHTLQSTALVHEAWMRLMGQERVSWQGRNHFFAVASMAMRRVLVDHARAHKADRRGGGAQREPLGTGFSEPQQREGEELFTKIDMLTLDEGLEMLAQRSERAARIVELRFFGGLTEAETADTLGIARSTVTLEWKAARAWLSNWMKRGEEA